MSVTYRAQAVQPLDPAEVLSVYRRGGWRLLDRTYGTADWARRQIAEIVRLAGASK